MRITPVFVSMTAFGLYQFGLVTQDGLREFVEAVQQGFQLAVFLRRGPIQRSRFWREFDVDGFAVGLIGKLEVGAMALGGVGGTDALSLATFHHSLQNCTFAETVDLFKAAPEFQESLCVACQGSILGDGVTLAFGNKNA